MLVQFLDDAELRIRHEHKFFGIGLRADLVWELPSRGVREDLILNILLWNLCKVWSLVQKLVEVCHHLFLALESYTNLIVRSTLGWLYELSGMIKAIATALGAMPSYIKSASKSVHQLHRTSPKAYSYLDYLDHLAHPTGQFCQYIMSMTTKAASDIGDIGAVVGGQPYITTSIITAIATITTSAWQPLDNLCKHNIIKMFSEFHVKRDATMRLRTSHHHRLTSRISTTSSSHRSWVRASTSRRPSVVYSAWSFWLALSRACFKPRYFLGCSCWRVAFTKSPVSIPGAGKGWQQTGWFPSSRSCRHLKWVAKLGQGQTLKHWFKQLLVTAFTT